MSSKISAERTSTSSLAEKPIRERQLAAYYRALGYVEGLRVLELGCGEGMGPSLLARAAASVTAVDHCEQALQIARRRYGKKGMEFKLMKVPPIDFPDGSFDAVVCFQMIEHLRQPGELVAEIQRVLRPSAIALLATVNKEETLSDNPYHLHEFSAGEFELFLKEYFGAVEMYGVFGDELFARYWQQNRKWVNAFMRADVFKLSSRLPRAIKSRLFDASSRFMRARLRRRNPQLCKEITHKNFIFREGEYEGCLDFFAVCRKFPSDDKK